MYRRAFPGTNRVVRASVVSAGNSPTYTPFYAHAFDTGTNNTAPTFGTREGATVMSNDITGPFGEALTLKCVTGGGGGQFYGMESLDNSGFDAANGDTVWISVWYYIPTAFCAGYGSTSGDGYGMTKWLRLQRTDTLNGADTGSTRLTLQANNFASQACSTTVGVWGIGAEGGFATTTAGGALDGLIGYGDDYGATNPAERQFPRDQWFQLQYKLVMHNTVAGSSLEMWLDDVYLGSCTPKGAALHVGTGTEYYRMVIGDYWNGGPPDANRPQSFYMSNMIMTKETPNTLDSGGRAYISPTHGAADF